MPHPRMHVSFGALDVIVQIVSEELDMRDRFRCLCWFIEVAREENESDITDVFSGGKVQMSDLERRFFRRIQDLRRSLD